MELDKARAEKAQQLLNHCINAPIESMVFQNDACSLLYLNPSYDFTMKGMDDDSADRKECLVELLIEKNYITEEELNKKIDEVGIRNIERYSKEIVQHGEK